MRLTQHRFETDLVPGGCEYAMLQPDGSPDDLPLLYVLHGGGGNRDHLAVMRPMIEAAIDAGDLPPVTAVTPSAGMSYYLDSHDGAERWETLLVEALPAAIPADTRRLLVTGISMGGVGTLRLSFRNPTRFMACASLEAGVDPFLTLEDMPDWYKALGDARLGPKFGDPIDEAFWQANNPANIAAADPVRLIESGLKIYIEVGTNDSLYNHHNVEFLHRVLFDNGIKHEYRTELGADHIGASIPGRVRDALGFLGKALNPPPQDHSTTEMRAFMAKAFRDAGVDPPAH